MPLFVAQIKDCSLPKNEIRNASDKFRDHVISVHRIDQAKLLVASSTRAVSPASV